MILWGQQRWISGERVHRSSTNVGTEAQPAEASHTGCKRPGPDAPSPVMRRPTASPPMWGMTWNSPSSNLKSRLQSYGTQSHQRLHPIQHRGLPLLRRHLPACQSGDGQLCPHLSRWRLGALRRGWLHVRHRHPGHGAAHDSAGHWCLPTVHRRLQALGQSLLVWGSVAALGVRVLKSIRLTFMPTTLWALATYIVMIAAGGSLMFRSLGGYDDKPGNGSD